MKFRSNARRVVCQTCHVETSRTYRGSCDCAGTCACGAGFGYCGKAGCGGLLVPTGSPAAVKRAAKAHRELAEQAGD